MDIRPVETVRIFDEIERQIGAQIQSAQSKAGDKLPNERELSTKSAMSRHGVREALPSLESVGLLDCRKGTAGGAFLATHAAQPLQQRLR